MRDIRVAHVQFQHAPGDKAYNLGRVRHFVAEAARAGVEIIAFPEMCLTGYWHVRKLARDAFEALAEPVPDGPCTQELLRLSREHRMTIGAGLIERGDDGRMYNAYVVAMPDGTLGGAPQAARVREPVHLGGRPIHRLRHAARLPRGRSDLLRQQHRRECSRHGAARRRDPACAASDGRLQFGESARNEAGGSRDLGAATRGSSGDPRGALRDQGSRRG